jgi:hypothetical protein
MEGSAMIRIASVHRDHGVATYEREMAAYARRLRERAESEASIEITPASAPPRKARDAAAADAGACTANNVGVAGDGERVRAMR